MKPYLTWMLAAGVLVTLDAAAQGKPSARPVAAAFGVTFALSLIAKPAPKLAGSIATVIFLTALLTSGFRLANRAGINPATTI